MNEQYRFDVLSVPSGVRIGRLNRIGPFQHGVQVPTQYLAPEARIWKIYYVRHAHPTLAIKLPGK